VTASLQTESFDLETRIEADHHQAIKLWLRLLTCTNLITNEIRSQLREDCYTTLPRFDLLAQLERSPDGLRMGELSKRMMVTNGNITGITDQLEREGLVERIVDTQDRRSFSVRLTKLGHETFAHMAQVHEGWVIEFFSGLSGREKDSLYGLLAKLKLHLNKETQ
jgi:DNA-binding MarR family transcriptional regulator